MKKKIIVVNDDYPAVDRKTVHATDYILNKKYLNHNIEIDEFNYNPEYLSLGYYIKLLAKARKHLLDDTVNNNSVKQHYDSRLAILIDPNEENPPSGQQSLFKMKQISEQFGFKTDVLDYDKLKNSYFMYDILFIRETTAVDNHTFELARLCEQHGLIVIDDSESIIACTNKIYQNELFKINKIPTLKTEIVCKQNLLKIYENISYPCIIKIPDSCCSLGVFKINNKAEFLEKSIELLKDYTLILTQEFYKTEFDWRIGVLDNKVLFACKYWMSRNGWQIIDHSDPNDDRISKCGQTENIEIQDVPEYIIETALVLSSLIGNGLYGVDLKEKDSSCVVIEINDCIDIDIPYEIKENDDSVLIEIFKTLKERLEIKKATN